MKKLQAYNPILVGTIPIEIDIDTSDLDIVCCWKEKNDFIEQVKRLFGNEDSFHIDENIIRRKECIVANFNTEQFEIEIFGQNTPTTEQEGYKHMLIEYSILQKRGEKFKQKIIQLKKQGIKTEPAFAQLLGIQGDPYVELLKY